MSRKELITSYENAFVSIIVPVFNEAEKINHNLELLIQELEPHFERFEVLVVSDGSTDGTNTILSKISMPNVRIMIFRENKGKGHAVRAGFSAAKGDYIFFIDGGMELHPRELRIFFGLMGLYNADIVVGSKRHPQSQIFYPWYRRLLSRIYQTLTRMLFKINVTDTQVGMKLFRKDVIQSILPYLKIDRYGFDLELLSFAHALGYKKILEAPVSLDYFVTSRRFILFDLAHVFRVGFSLLSDTFKLYRRLRKTRGHQ